VITVVTWFWKPVFQQARARFSPEHVRILRDMVARHYQQPHRFVCITDQPETIDADIKTIPDRGDFKSVPAPSGVRNPSCYRRLWMFAPDAAGVLGQRFVSLDLDLVICGDLSPVFDRPEDFVIYGDTNPRTFYNGSMVLMTAGCRSQVWTEFDPATSIKHAFRAGHHGSDQAWISYCLGPKEAKWTQADGVYSFRNHLKGQTVLPPGVKVVNFHGNFKPWHSEVQQGYVWARNHYKATERLAVSA
jgi:hypothetical protein